MKNALIYALEYEAAKLVNRQQRITYPIRAVKESDEENTNAIVIPEDLFKKYLGKDKTLIQERPKCYFCGKKGHFN